MPGKNVAKKSASKRRAATKVAKNNASEFTDTFNALRKTMAGCASELDVTADEAGKYSLATKSKSWRGGPMFFGAVTLGKAYVSCHLMALYVVPGLVKKVPPELKKRMQGKACLNFKRPDDALFEQLADLTRLCVEAYRTKKWL